MGRGAAQEVTRNDAVGKFEIGEKAAHNHTVTVEKKKLYEVGTVGALVCCSGSDRMGFLTSDRMIYWLNFSEDKRFTGLKFHEGQQVWLYVVVELGRVIGAVQFSGENIDEIPKHEEVLI